MNILVSLHRGYGMGDAVAMSAVMRHVVASRPDIAFDYRAHDGQHEVCRGIARYTFGWASSQPTHEVYDGEVLITLYEEWRGYTDRPNSRVGIALLDHFNLSWRPELARYQIQVDKDIMDDAAALLTALTHQVGEDGRRCVAIHYQGDSSPARKNLTTDEARVACEAVERLGRVPVLLDWRNGSDPAILGRFPTVGTYAAARMRGGDPVFNAAVISQCEAFVGVDSGPAKCASATETPSLVVWTGHHPAQFHDPAPNTFHLVPIRHQHGPPINNAPKVLKFFEEHYRYREYAGITPSAEIEAWLEEVLR